MFALIHSKDRAGVELPQRYGKTPYGPCARSFCNGIHEPLEYGKVCWLSWVLLDDVGKHPTKRQPALYSSTLNIQLGAHYQPQDLTGRTEFESILDHPQKTDFREEPKIVVETQL